jgi:hypothetical protein
MSSNKLQAVVAILQTPQGLRVQGGGTDIPRRHVAAALRAYADQLEKDERATSLIFVPGGKA